MPTTYTEISFLGVVFALRSTCNIVVPADAGALATVIGSGFSTKYPFWYTEVPGSVALLSNGIDPMQRWDGATGLMEVAGVPPPETAMTITIAGDYSAQAGGAFIYGLVRFYDAYGNFSDLSPIGLGSYGASSIHSVTRNPDTDGVTPAAVYGGVPNQITAADQTLGLGSLAIGPAGLVPKPTGAYALKVVGRQLLRNTPGQATTFYVDIDTRDLTSTTFNSYKNDAQLQAEEAVPLLDAAGGILANTHGFPPSWKAVTTSYLGRVFATTDVVYSIGSVVVTSYSKSVQGVGTNWPANFAGRSLFLSNPPAEYEIASVDVATQVITLSDAYNGPTDQFALYGIRPAATEWRLIYYTPSGEPESWPPTFALSLQDDGDEITGLMQLGSFLYILEHRHIYRLTFLTDPAVDGAIFLSSRRGCLNQRMWVQAENTAYTFDELGVHAFTGGNSLPISDPIQDLWRENSESRFVINWNADTSLWSSSYSATHTTVRFFVAMSGSRYPHHALCFNYRQNRWWIEEYPRPICSTNQMQIGATVRTIAGLDAGTLVSLDVGYLDGSRGIVPTTTGTVTATTPCSLTDSLAYFTDELINMPVVISQGRAKGQIRRIIQQTDGGTRLITSTPWNIKPDVGDTYQVGAINWHWRPGWFRFLDDSENSNARDIEVLFQPQTDGIADLEVFFDREEAPRVWRTSRKGTATVTAGDSKVEIDLTKEGGWGIFRMEGHSERFVSGDFYMSPKLSGFQHKEPVKIYRMSISGVNSEG